MQTAIASCEVNQLVKTVFTIPIEVAKIELNELMLAVTTKAFEAPKERLFLP